MARRQYDTGQARFAFLALFLIGAVSCTAAYIFMSTVLRPAIRSPASSYEDDDDDVGGGDSRFVKVARVEETTSGGRECCGGIEHLELWGAAVKWGTNFKFNTSEECCRACKAMCGGNSGPCLCDSWVFCGNQAACGSRFGEVS